MSCARQVSMQMGWQVLKLGEGQGHPQLRRTCLAWSRWADLRNPEAWVFPLLALCGDVATCPFPRSGLPPPPSCPAELSRTWHSRALCQGTGHWHSPEPFLQAGGYSARSRVSSCLALPLHSDLAAAPVAECLLLLADPPRPPRPASHPQVPFLGGSSGVVWSRLGQHRGSSGGRGAAAQT